MSDLFNPQVEKFLIGIKKPREITIYPMSVGQQKKAIAQIQGGLETLSQIDMSKLKGVETPEDAENAQGEMGKIIDIISENITMIIELITDEDAKVDIDEMTTQQLSDLIVKIYDMNFDGMVKNFQSLSGRVKEILPS